VRALIFPGQGSQYVGMAGVVGHAEGVLDMYERARSVLNYDLLSLIEEGDEATLTRTDHTQPALFVTEMAWVRLLSSRGVLPDVLAGHSLGEFSAFCAAGAFSFEDGVRLVRTRGEIMARAAAEHPGAMAAVIGLKACDLGPALGAGTLAGVVEVANYNTEDQIVVSGDVAAVDAVIAHIKGSGSGRAMKLKVGAPFHSSIMTDGAEEFKVLLRDIAITPARSPVIGNVAAEVVTDPDAIRAELYLQFKSPVQWVSTLKKLDSLGVDEYVEVGPRAVLAGMAAKVLPGRDIWSVEGRQWQVP
jgi:[acyl-carrier-protein] S-malonyltransferase